MIFFKKPLRYPGLVILLICFLILQSNSVRAQKARMIHVLVALCDNKYQGIVPVPAAIGNGQDPANNLYWGCGYGLKTFFSKNKQWVLISKGVKPGDSILERCIFKHKSQNIYMVADAYDGKFIKNTTIDFLNEASGNTDETVVIEGLERRLDDAELIAYIGHNGLMDFQVDAVKTVSNSDNKKATIILACASFQYFKGYIQNSGAEPLLWTTNLVCPEAYTLHTAIECWLNNQKGETLRKKVAETYNQYQKCGFNGAYKLFKTGF